jgi:NAD(P)-dependent dehydrogenase (short-subunit alcohol dehydrogenase family)
MLRIDETISGSCPPQTAFEYLAAFDNIQAWDPTVLSARRLTAGPIREGARFALVMLLGIRPMNMVYTLAEMKPPCRLVLHGRGASFRAIDTLAIEPAGHGFRLNYAVRIDFDRPAGKSLGRLVAPLVRWNGRRAVKRLQTILGGDAAGLPRLTAGTRLADRLILPGLVGFTRWGYRWGRGRWPLTPRPLAGRRVVLTGATSGIGLAAAQQLLTCGAHLTLVGRHPEKAASVHRRFQRQFGAEAVDLEMADLSRLREVRALADRLRQRYAAIHVLVNNAGALFDQRAETDEGFEQTLATDLLAPYLLTRLLVPRLRPSSGACIVNVASGGMYTQKIRLDDLTLSRDAYNGATAYARAKRGLVILSEYWARELAPLGIRVHAMHPGWVDTPGLHDSLPDFYRFVHPLLRSPDQGADTITWLAASDVAHQTSGLFWLDRKPRATHVFPGTRETPVERRAFLAALDRMVQPFFG